MNSVFDGSFGCGEGDRSGDAKIIISADVFFGGSLILLSDDVEGDIHGFNKNIGRFIVTRLWFLCFGSVAFEVIIEELFIGVDLVGILSFGQLFHGFDRLGMIFFLEILGGIGVSFDSAGCRGLIEVIFVVPGCETFLDIEWLYLSIVFHLLFSIR